ncbi:MAG: helix-turn-helix domain-containing protein, partial [Candidatus Thiodiazotropha sp. 6PLUC5]
LFHRLNVIRIHLPSLRQRREDIPLLMGHFLKSAAEELAVDSKLLLPETEGYLSQLEWPGNVRQLENTARWLTVMASGQEIHIEDLPTELKETEVEGVAQDDWRQSLRGWVKRRLNEGCEGILNEAEPDFEMVMIETALEHTAGKRQDAARLLGWGRNTLTRKIKELGMEER